MKYYRAIYKCRLCGEVFEDVQVPYMSMGGVDGNTDVKAIGDLCNLSSQGHSFREGCGIGLYRYMQHNCQGEYKYSYGFADFQGLKFMEDEE